MTYFFSKDAPAHEWDSSHCFIQKRRERKDGNCQYQIQGNRRQLGVDFHRVTKRRYHKVMDDIYAIT